jgi:hypothetical protein
MKVSFFVVISCGLITANSLAAAEVDVLIDKLKAAGETNAATAKEETTNPPPDRILMLRDIDPKAGARDESATRPLQGVSAVPKFLKRRIYILSPGVRPHARHELPLR